MRWHAILLLMFVGTACLFGPSRGAKVLGYRHGIVYLTQRGAYRVGMLPDRWRERHARERAVAFHDADSQAVITTNAYCGPSFEDLPLTSLMGHLFTGIAADRILATLPLSLAGREALRQQSIRRVDGVAVYCDAVVVKKDGCQFDFFLTAPVTVVEQVRPRFEAFYRGFVFPVLLP